MFAVILAPLLLNLVDLGYYTYVRMEVENAAQAGAQAAWANCTASPPSQSLCDPSSNTPMTNAVDSAVHSTNLGASVTWTNKTKIWTDTAHPYGIDTYCPNSTTNSLAYSNAATCSSTTSTGASPGYYVMVSVSRPYSPIFTGATIASLFPSTITATSYQRLY